ncbi:protease ATP-binding subunit domain-containing protein [Pseudomonas phage EM]|uniref:Protease ATP-binding subunit domain-containing protein n=1 Tax=Pseudomonas phage EM TaxID=2936914 RepID=A0AAE9HHL4_9CAUD|nr:protease ATP-binding subunit domain-containing protein [Pseudomonas phage EM]UPW35947.1 protease ATP-binding subunit domain-containing protein [Pseudomonas phage EM]
MNESTRCCSFCGEDESNLKALIVAVGVLICDKCVALCVEILQDNGHWQVDTCSSEEEKF